MDDLNELPDIQSLKELKKIGHITPSSNTALEAVTAMMSAPMAGCVSNHFSRVGVKSVTLDEVSDAQFGIDRMLSAAEMLSDAPLDAILWNGTSGSWRGIERDLEIARQIKEKTGKITSTSTLAFFDAFARCGIKRIALAVPYVSEVTNQIKAVYRRHGYEVVSSAQLEQSINLDIGLNSLETIRKLLRDADSPEAECIAVVCTNLPAALVADEMEKELGKPVFDSIAVTFWKGCRMIGINPVLRGWGKLLGGAL